MLGATPSVLEHEVFVFRPRFQQCVEACPGAGLRRLSLFEGGVQQVAGNALSCFGIPHSLSGSSHLDPTACRGLTDAKGAGQAGTDAQVVMVLNACHCPTS